jgi:hypothetical protein
MFCGGACFAGSATTTATTATRGVARRTTASMTTHGGWLETAVVDVGNSRPRQVVEVAAGLGSRLEAAAGLGSRLEATARVASRL